MEEDLQAAIQPGKTTAWYDDALFRYANWLATSGKLRVLGEGRWERAPDFVRALAVYRRIVQATRSSANGRVIAEILRDTKADLPPDLR